LKRKTHCGFRGQRGIGLVETLVAVAVLGTAVVAFAVALSAGSIAVGDHDGEAVAQGLAQSQLEYTKSYAYSPGATTYPWWPRREVMVYLSASAPCPALMRTFRK